MENYEILCIETGNNFVECLKFGKGKKTMVILPGLSLRSVILSAKAIVSSYSCFESEYTVYMFDRAKNIIDGYNIISMAYDTAEAINKLNLSEIYLFGVSQGGAIALVLAVNYPDLIKKLVLASTFTRLCEKTDKVLREWTEIAKTCDHVALNRKIFGFIYSEKTLIENAVLLSLLSEEGDKNDCERFIKLAEATGGFDISEKLYKITCPTLVLGAKNDKVVPESEIRYLAERIGCDLYLYENYGHAVYDEAPDFKRRIAEFFGE